MEAAWHNHSSSSAGNNLSGDYCVPVPAICDGNKENTMPTLQIERVCNSISTVLTILHPATNCHRNACNAETRLPARQHTRRSCCETRRNVYKVNTSMRTRAHNQVTPRAVTVSVTIFDLDILLHRQCRNISWALTLILLKPSGKFTYRQFQN
jgi:hypothetical protein